MAILLLASCQAGAQDNSGFRALGELIGGKVGSTRAYDDAYQQRIETEASYLGAVRARQEADAAEQQLQMIEILRGLWVDAGLPPEEAAAIAATFEYTPALDALVVRAKREGSQKTLSAAGDAYKSYRYLLANQLLIAGLMARNSASPSAGTTPEP